MTPFQGLTVDELGIVKKRSIAITVTVNHQFMVRGDRRPHALASAAHHLSVSALFAQHSRARKPLALFGIRLQLLLFSATRRRPARALDQRSTVSAVTASRDRNCGKHVARVIATLRHDDWVAPSAPPLLILRLLCA